MEILVSFISAFFGFVDECVFVIIKQNNTKLTSTISS